MVSVGADDLARHVTDHARWRDGGDQRHEPHVGVRPRRLGDAPDVLTPVGQSVAQTGVQPYAAAKSCTSCGRAEYGPEYG